MSQHRQLLDTVFREVATGKSPPSASSAAERIEPLSIGLRSKAPILLAGTRLFRVRRMNTKPSSVSEVGAPPASVATIGRLNEAGQSVLYVADSPDTAFLEARAGEGPYCLSEWRTEPERVVVANGGMLDAFLTANFPINLDRRGRVLDGLPDDDVAQLFRKIFTQSVDHDALLYRWSIACGMANGFAYTCERTAKEEVDGNTIFSGRFPFSGIAYASIRSDKQAVNFAFNDLGQSYLRLNHVQWVERGGDGSITGRDYSSTWESDGTITWSGRPARFAIAPGGSARLVKVDTTVWRYEAIDGNVPGFV